MRADRAGTDVTGCSRTSTGRMISEPLQLDILTIEQHYRRNTEQQENKCFSGIESGSRYRDHSREGRARKGLFISCLLYTSCCLLASLCSLILSKLFKPYMLCSFRYKLVTFSIALIPVILWPVFLILSLCFLWLLWFVVNFANFVIFLTVYRNILQALCFSQSGSVTCCRSKTKPEHKPHQRSGTQPDTTKRNTTN